MKLVTVMRTAMAGLVLIGAAAAGASLAQPKPPGRAAALERLAECRKLTEDTRRLACYDQAAAVLDQAEAKGDIVVVDREQARSVRRQAFGFNLPSLDIFDRGDKPETVDSVTLKVERAWRDGAGRWNFQLEGGQIWRQIDSAELGVQPRAGAIATVRRASLGSFMLSIDGHPAVRAHRDN